MESAVSYLCGVLGIPLVQFIKNELKWSGRKAVVLSIVVAGIMGLASLFLNDALQVVPYDWHNLFEAGGRALAASFFAYNMLLKAEA